MDKIKKVGFKHFAKNIILAILILLVLLFGKCKYPETGMLLPSEACGEDHFFKEMIIKTLSIKTAFETSGQAKFAIISIPFKLAVLSSIILLLYVIVLILKKKNDESHFLQLKRLLNVSFWISFVTFFVIYVFSFMFRYS